MFASSSGAAGSRPPSIPRAIRASSCASLMRSMWTVVVASSSLGTSDATTRTNSTGCVHAAVISAGLPKACHASQRSRKNSSLSLLRETCLRLVNGLANHQGQQIYFGIAATDGHDADLVGIFERNSPPAFARPRGRQASPKYAGTSAHTYLAV